MIRLRIPHALFALAPAVVLALPRPALANLDVAFALDTTGSMGGEIREAKERIQQIAESLESSRPNETIRFAVVAYKDRGDEYLTRIFDLTPSVEDTFRFLGGLSAAGGGDAPEDVLRALGDAIDKLSWDMGSGVERQVFLIGDAPPHFDYQDDPTTEQIVERARRKQIVLNGVGCRSLPADGIAFFRKIAYATEGSYQHIGRVGTDHDLAGALLEALAPSGSKEREAGRPIAARGLAPRASVLAPAHDAGILVTLGASAAGKSCTVDVALPDGVELAGEAAFSRGKDAVIVDLEVRPGKGGVHAYALDECIETTTPIHVRLGGR